MSKQFQGVTFAKRRISPVYEAVVNRAMFADGILTGCNLRISGFRLSMEPGQLMICGRQIRNPQMQSWSFAEKPSGYGRLVLTIDMTRAASRANFDQAFATVEYATTADGFLPLQQQDINSAGIRYQAEICTVSLAPTGISGIVSKLDKTGFNG